MPSKLIGRSLLETTPKWEQICQQLVDEKKIATWEQLERMDSHAPQRGRLLVVAKLEVDYSPRHN
jgi:hypothetical protein